MSRATYKAIVSIPSPSTSCECSACEWTGTFEQLDEIGDCYLTPGDPSPAGRCPNCEWLAYVSEPKRFHVTYKIVFTIEGGEIDRMEFHRRLDAAIEYGLGDGENLTDGDEGYVSRYQIEAEEAP